MSESPVHQQKVCRVCGTDCSGKPRVKDREGRYMCKVCADGMKAQQRAIGANGAAAPAARQPASDRELLTQLLHESAAAKAATTATCESCGAEIRKGAVICTACGFDTRSGKKLKSKVEHAKEPKAKRSKRSKGSAASAQISFPPALTAVISILIGGSPILLHYAGTGPAAVVLAVFVVLGVACLLHLAISIEAIISAGVLIGLVVLIVPFGALWYAMARCPQPHLKNAYLGWVIAWCLSLAFLNIAGGLARPETIYVDEYGNPIDFEQFEEGRE